MRRSISHVRRYLVTGLVVIAPVGVTVFILAWLFHRLDAVLGRYLPTIHGVRLPGLGLVALLLLLIVVGWASQKAVGRRLLVWWNGVLSRLPLVRAIYRGSSQIARAVLERRDRLFEGCALIEYPSPGTYALVFVSGAAPAEFEERIGQAGLSVFLPTAPNPTSGYLLMLPVADVHRLRMSVEEGVRLVLSAGLALPEDPMAVGGGTDHAGNDDLASHATDRVGGPGR